MLKVACSSNNNIIDQRRATRISSNCELEEESKLVGATSGSVSRSISNSKLKCSTAISKVPSVKIRSKQQPVAASALDECQKLPSRLARPIVSAAAASTQPGVANRVKQQANQNALSTSLTGSSNSSSSTSSQQIRVRPTSLALRAPSATSRGLTGASSVALKAPASVGNLKPTFTSSKEAQVGTSASIKQQVKRKCTVGKQQPVTSNSVLNDNNSSSNKASVNSRQISRLSGLKNLVAVVHPQHSQCVNQTVMAATANKLNPTTVSIRYESGKPTTTTTTDRDGNNNNSNNSREKRKESKQDDSQIIRQLKTATTATSTTINAFSYGNNQINNGHFESTTSPRQLMTPPAVHSTQSITFTNKIATGATAVKDDSNRIDHFTHSNYPDLLLSVASNAADNADDKKQQTKANKKPLNKHLANQAQPSMQEEVQQPLITNYSNHSGSKSTTTKSVLFDSSSSRRDNDNHKDASILSKDHMQPKPMGQQVLSLMMLDVGLLPASNNLSQKRPSPHKKSHVRIQRGSFRDTQHDVDESNLNLQLYDNCPEQQQQSSIVHERDEVDRLNHNAIGLKQSNNYYSSRQPTNAHEILRLQVHKLTGDNGENSRSISLPSSPSIRLRVQPTGRSKTYTPKAVNTSDSLRAPSSTQNLSHRVAHENQLYYNTSTPTRLPTPTSRLLQASYDQLLSISDDTQEAHSLTSSSCSSLNQCPPLLALSNQLSNFKFDELLIKATSNEAQSLPSRENQQNKETAHQERCPDSIHLPLDQVAQVEKQHELLLSSESITLHQKKQNHAQPCTQPKEDSTLEKISSGKEQLSSSATSRPDEVVYGEEGSLDHQLRRQQQIRSHSISGQDFQLNGQYQRLKQSLYTQQNVGDDYLKHNNQGNNRVQQVPSQLYPQHQQYGRSPSPLSTSSQVNYGSPNRDIPIKYERQARSQFHTSLECLNAGYSDYQQYQVQKLQLQQLQHQHQHQHHQQQQQQQQQYQQQQLLHQQNQHYAASFVLVPPPVNTVINQNGDQDLAAAAMGVPIAQYHSMATPLALPSSSNRTGITNNQTQNLLNRAMAQVSQSPIRRLGLNGTGSSSNVLNQLSSLQHPMRAGHSSLSLASPSFIVEDKLQNEIRKLQGELNSEKEKNEALNSQLNINSSLMAAFEQSLTTLNTRLRQLTTLNEKKDTELEELREQLKSSKVITIEDKSQKNILKETARNIEEKGSDRDTTSERVLLKTIEDLKRQLIEKDRLLTDTRLEALSAAHQLEQLESKLSGEHSLMVNEDELDEGVMVVNHSPSDSEAITDSAHFSEITSQITNTKHRYNKENYCDDVTFMGNTYTSPKETIEDHQMEADQRSNLSSKHQTEYQDEEDPPKLSESISQQFNETDSGVMCKLMDNLLVTSTSS